VCHAGIVTENLTARSVVESYFDALNRHDWPAVESLVSPGYRHHGNGRGFTFGEFRARTSWLMNGIHDLHIETLAVVSDGDDVAVRWIARGAHQGSLNGERPTSRSVSFPGITMFHVEDGHVVEDWQTFDERHLYIQLSPFATFD
jgi:predicted ester cyclase